MATQKISDDILVKKKPGFMSRFRTLARLAAVQALYQIEFLKANPQNVISKFLIDGLTIDEEKVVSIREPKLFKGIVEGVVERQKDIDHMIAEAGMGEVNAERFEPILKNVLRAGIFELLASSDVPAPVIINEYLDIAHLYYLETEPKIVNGILNRLAQKLREA
jgi:N utilization substance protein B